MEKKCSKTERSRTPGPSSSTQKNSQKQSASKKYTPNNLSRKPNLLETTLLRRTKPKLNETVQTDRSNLNETRRPFLNDTAIPNLHSENPKIKPKLMSIASSTQELELDLDYNDYLVALLKQQIVTKKMKEHQTILDEQILVQSENLYKRKQNYNEIVTEMRMLQKQSEVVEMMDFLQENMDKIQCLYSRYDAKMNLTKCEKTLSLECDKVVLQNIKAVETQQEYDALITVLQTMLSTTEKLIETGRNFEGIHEIADSIRSLLKLKDSIQESQEAVINIEKEAFYKLLQDMSDSFAKKHPKNDSSNSLKSSSF